MATWCYDAGLSARLGRTQFKKPYAANDWLREKQLNDFPIKMMQYITEMNTVFTNRGKWDAIQTKQYRGYIEQLGQFYDNV